MSVQKIIIALILITVQTSLCQSQTGAKTIKVEEFNWTISIPDIYKAVSESEWNKHEEVGKKAVEETYGQEVINQSVTIMAYKKGQFNSFDANWQPFDEAIDGSYKESNVAVNEILFHTFQSQMAGAKLDSASSIQNISGLDFYRFDINIEFPNGKVFKSTLLSRLFGKKEFSMNLAYLDEKAGQKMLDAMLNSSFK